MKLTIDDSSRWCVSIILVLYDPDENTLKHNALKELFDSLCLIKNKYELVIVINQPVEISSNIIELINEYQFCSSVMVVQAVKNLGPAGGFNLGYSKCKQSDLYVYLSLDAIVIDGDILKKMIQLFEKNNCIGIAHPLSQFEDDDTFNIDASANLQAYNNILLELEGMEGDSYSLAKEKESCIIDSSSLKFGVVQSNSALIQAPLTFLGIRKEVADLTKGFDASMICGENIDLCLRALEFGYKTVKLNSTIIGHRRISFRVLGQGHGSLIKNRDVLSVEMIAYLNKKHGNFKNKYYKFRFKYIWPLVLTLRWVRRILK